MGSHGGKPTWVNRAKLKRNTTGVRWCNHSIMCIGPFVEHVPVFCWWKTNQIASFTGLFDDSGVSVHPRFAGKLLFYDSCHVGNEILRCKSKFGSFSGLWLEIFREKKWKGRQPACFRKQSSHFLLAMKQKSWSQDGIIPLGKWKISTKDFLGHRTSTSFGHQLRPKDLPRVELWTIKYQPIGSTVDPLRHHQYSN